MRAFSVVGRYTAAVTDVKPAPAVVDDDNANPPAGWDAPAADLVPSGSVTFNVDVDDEVVAKVRWPRWAGLGVGGLMALTVAVILSSVSPTDLWRLLQQLIDGVIDGRIQGPWLALVLGSTGGVLLAAYAASAALLNTTTVTFAQNNLVLRTSPLPLFWRTRSYALADIVIARARKQEHLDGNRRGSALGQYALILQLKGNREVAALWDLGGRDQAKSVVRAINARLDVAKADRA